MKCILCKSNNFQELFRSRNWQTVKCKKCGLITTLRDKSEVNYDFYHRDDDYKKFEGLFRNIFKKRLNIIKRFTNKKGKVLEIGCSNGVMLDLFHEEGWETWGVEPSENIEYAIDKGHRVFQTTFEKLNLTQKFDLTVLNHTLEHMDNPLEVLKKAHKMLEKDGTLFVDVPNFGSLSARLLGRHWPYLLPEEHNFQFTPETLRQIFDKAGFKVVHFESRSGIFEHANPFTELWESLTNLKMRFVTSSLNLPYSAIATFLNAGDSMSMVGKK